MTRTLTALAVLLAVIGVWFMIRGGEPPQAPAAAPAENPAATGAAMRTAESPVAGDSATRTSVAPAPAIPERPTAQRWTLVGRIEPDPAATVTRARLLVHRGRAADRTVSFARIMDVTVPGQQPTTRDLTLAVENEPLASTAIAADGSFRIEGIAIRDLRLSVDDDHYALAQVTPVHAPFDATLVDAGTLPSMCGALVIGRVLGMSDFSGCEIDVASDPDPMEVLRDPQGFMSRVMRGGGSRQVVDGEGRFSLRAVPPSPRTTLVLHAPDHVASEQRLALGKGETHEVVVVARRCATLMVHVVDESDAPVTKTKVGASPDDVQGDFARARQDLHATTGDDGIATLHGLRDGTWSITAEPVGFLFAKTQVEIEGDKTTHVQLRLLRGASVSGRVVDRAKAPVADARIALFPDFTMPVIGRVSEMTGPSLAARVAENSPVRTDTDGRFSISGLTQAAEASIAVWHPDFVGAVAPGVRPGTNNLEIVLDRPGVVRGRAIAANDRAPLSEFEVRTVTTMAMVMERPTALARVTKESDGRFVLSALPPGRTTLRIDAESFARFERSVDVPIGEELDLGDLAIDAAALVRGRVVDPDGRGVARARVAPSRRGLADNPVLAAFTDDVHAVTATDGSFELVGLAPGRVELKARHGSYASAKSKRIELGAGQQVDGVEIVLSNGGAIAGQVVLAAGQDFRHWQIIATLEMQAATYGTSLDADGRFHLEHLDPGRYDVQAMETTAIEAMQSGSRDELRSGKSFDFGKLIKDMQEHVVTARAQVRDGETTELVLDAAELDTGEGELTVVIDVGGKPLADGMVELTQLDGDRVEGVKIGVVVTGEATFRGLRSGLVRLQVRAGMTFDPLGDPLSFELDASGGPQRRTWSLPGGAITGRVVDAERGDPISGAVVRLVSAEAGREGRGRDLGFSLTGADGAFAFRGLGEGSFTVLADDMLMPLGRDEVTGRIDAIRLAAGEERRGLELRARRGAGIRIVVADESGVPVPHARALAVGPDGEPLGSLPFAVTDRDGVAELAGLPAGPARIVAWSPEFAPGASEVQTLAADGRAEFHVGLTLGTTTSLTLLDETGAPLRGASVSVRFDGGPWIPAVVLGRFVDADGKIELGRLPRGSVEFAVTHPRAQFTARREVSGAHAALVLQR
ncbi:MAG: carboxypeptidase regulatory-like domain-containing protein [Planctomycetes bacterium]|nr:carboxypeptidase regulatory-like domain-containing protein [Planctomycetota bacterium]